MLTLWRQTFLCLTPSERRRSIGVIALMILMAAFEVVGVASFMPFLAVLANPEMIETNRFLKLLYNAGGFRSTDYFLVALGITAFGLLVVSAIVRGGTFYVLSLFVQMQRHSLGCRLLEGYLRQPYAFFLSRNTSDMSMNILSEVDVFVDRALYPIAQMISFGLVVLAILTFLIVIDPATAIVVGAVLAATYIGIFRIVRSSLLRSGRERAAANRQRFGAASEALGGIKSIKILGRENRYLERFRNSSYIVARRFAMTNMLAQMPRYAVEAVGFGGIILIALVLTLRHGGQGGNLGAVLPLLGLYGFAGYRLLPAMQAIYQNVAGLKFAAPVVQAMTRELELAGSAPAPPCGATSPLRLARELRLESVSYHYPNARTAGVHGISLRIPRGSSLGIIGTTGAGKTTLVDVILGLLEPQKGQIVIDGIGVNDANRRSWQDNLGYVPQEIYLTDSTVAENIALGLRGDEVNIARVHECARMARIHDFVNTELPQGYATFVGERGVRLSGGQRQRIGIARALYTDPDVVIFDEATSALDNETESEVMEAIGMLSGKKTLIIIAHRLTTIEACDTVVRLSAGRLVDIQNKKNQGAQA